MSKPSKFLSSFFLACLSLFIFSNANATFTMSDYPTLTPEQVNPYNGALKQAYQTYEQGLQAAHMRSMYEQDLQTKQLQNQMLKQQLSQERRISQETTTNTQAKIMIFSQNKYPTYLGCLNCPYYAKDSIHNDGTSFGSENGKKSIFNRHCAYGSKDSNVSACNSHATHPPVIVDNSGTNYGLLTLNTRLHGAITINFKMVKNTRLY